MEEIRIKVDLATDQAVQNTQNLVPLVSQLEQKTDDLATTVGKADQALDKMAASTDEVATSATKAKSAVGQAGDEIIGFAKDVDQATESEEDLNKKLAETVDAAKKSTAAIDALAAAEKELEDKAKKAAAAQAEAAKKTKDAEKGGLDAATAYSKFAAVLGSIGLGGFAGLELLSKIITTLRENAERTAEAIRSIGGEQRQFDAKVADIVDNLGLTPDDQGAKRARSAAISFMRSTGTNVDQAAQIMAGAQGAGFSVLDPSKPESDGKSAGFGVAAEVGKFAARTRIDPATANQLMKILAGQGVKTADDARGVIAKIEAGQNSTAITSPAEYTQALVSIAAGRTDLDNSVKQLAAAAVNTKSGEIAAQRVLQYRQVAAGSPSKLSAIGALAEKAGVLNASDIADAMMPSEKAEDFKARDEKLKRDTAAKEAAFKDQEAALQERRAKLAAANKQDPAVDREAAALARERTKAAAERKAAADDLQRDISADAAKRRAAAAGVAYQRLPADKQEAFLANLMAGKSPDEQKAIIAQITDGSEGQQGVRALTSAAGAAAAADAAAKMRAATGAQVTKRNETFLSGNATGREAVQAAEAAAGVNAAPAGSRMAEEIAGLADQSIRQLRATPGAGGYASVFARVYSITEGKSDEDLKNRQMAAISVARFKKFVAGLSGSARAAIGEKYIAETGQWLNSKLMQVLKGDDMVGASGVAAARMAAAVGNFIDFASKTISNIGETVPSSDVPIGPALQGPSMANPKTTTGPMPSPMIGGNGDSSESPAPTPSSPTASAVGVTYNITVGSYFSSQGANGFDFPGRGELLDS